MSAPAIGIDLGTTYSCVGVFHGGRVQIIANDQGSKTTPSCVAFTDSDCLVGEAAKRQGTENPENVVFDAKRMIGREFNDRELEQDLEHWPFKVCDDMGEPKITVKCRGNTKLVSPVEITAKILTKLRELAEAYLGETVTDVVITVPAVFNSSQRQATKDAGKMAGLNVSIIDEPMAVGLAYGLDKRLNRRQRVLIFDLGGGSLDVSVVAVVNNVIKILSTAGDTRVGGECFDQQLVKYFSSAFEERYGKCLSGSPLALSKLKAECEKAKRTVSKLDVPVAYIDVDSPYEGIDFSNDISRVTFEKLCARQFQGTLDTVQRALDDANLSSSSIDEVILVGGSTRIPKIRKLLQNFFYGKPLKTTINPDEAVACGAALQAAALSVGRSLGADDDLLLDVMPFSLGIRAEPNEFHKVIERGSHVPIRRELVLALSADNQTMAEIAIYKGEHRIAGNNVLIGEMVVDDLPAAPLGQVTMVVTFDVDVDGTITVSARDKKTGQSEEIIIRYLNLMNREELRRMQRDAA